MGERFGTGFGCFGQEVEQNQAWQIPRSLRLDQAASSPPRDLFGLPVDSPVDHSSSLSLAAVCSQAARK
jgi:hypothetical protein